MENVFGVFESSHGIVAVTEDGNVIESESELSDWLLTIQKVDIEEIKHYHNLNKIEFENEGDVLDFGYWDKKGKYHKPDFNWRKDTYHSQELTKTEIKNIIRLSKLWIKENRN